MKAAAMIAGMLVRILRPLSAFTLMAIMILMVADVMGRYLFNMPIRGAYEITEFLMCIMILAAMPLVSLWGRHVEASLVADFVPRLAPLLQWIGGLLSVLLFGYMSMLLWRYGGQLAAQNAQSLFGGIPQAPFAYYMSILLAVTSLSSAIALIRRDSGPAESADAVSEPPGPPERSTK